MPIVGTSRPEVAYDEAAIGRRIRTGGRGDAAHG